MLSYTWGYTVGCLISSLTAWCDRAGGLRKRRYVWSLRRFLERAGHGRRFATEPITSPQGYVLFLGNALLAGFKGKLKGCHRQVAGSHAANPLWQGWDLRFGPASWASTNIGFRMDRVFTAPFEVLGVMPSNAEIVDLQRGSVLFRNRTSKLLMLLWFPFKSLPNRYPEEKRPMSLHVLDHVMRLWALAPGVQVMWSQRAL